MTTQEMSNVPKTACRFQATEFSISDSNGDDAKTAPFRMVARSGKPIDHPYWGKIVHDTAGFFVSDRGRIPIDYNHGPEVIGFANHFGQNEDGDLEVSGTLTPGRMKEDRALDVIHKASLGVPWEASINFGGTGIEKEDVPEGESVDVNGFQFDGPGVVIRKWPLRGVAVVAYGADQFTSTEFSASDTVAVTTIEKEPAMAKSLEELEAIGNQVALGQEDEAPADVEDTQSVDAEADNDTEEAVDDQVQTEVAAVEPEMSQYTSFSHEMVVLTAKRYQDAFGAKGLEYLAEGLSEHEATLKFTQDLREENADLRKRLAAAAEFSGEDDGVSASAKTVIKKKEPAIADPDWL